MILNKIDFKRKKVRNQTVIAWPIDNNKKSVKQCLHKISCHGTVTNERCTDRQNMICHFVCIYAQSINVINMKVECFLPKYENINITVSQQDLIEGCVIVKELINFNYILLLYTQFNVTCMKKKCVFLVMVNQNTLNAPPTLFFLSSTHRHNELLKYC